MSPPTAVLEHLTTHRPHKIWWRRWAKRAAVTAVLADQTVLGTETTSSSSIDDESGVSVLLMRRTVREGDPWSGHMSFPGGRWDSSDRHVYDTAVRELTEETGLDIATHGQYLGRLSDIQARPPTLRRRPLVVTPFVFQLHTPPIWQLDPREAEELLWVPLAFLHDPANRETMQWQHGRLHLTLPCYHYQGRRIWGLTLKMLDELVAVVQ